MSGAFGSLFLQYYATACRAGKAERASEDVWRFRRRDGDAKMIAIIFAGAKTAIVATPSLRAKRSNPALFQQASWIASAFAPRRFGGRRARRSLRSKRRRVLASLLAMTVEASLQSEL